MVLKTGDISLVVVSCAARRMMAEMNVYMDKNVMSWPYMIIFETLFSRYKRKGSSSLGLDNGRQGVSWEDSNKKQKGGNKKGADRYFSTVSRQLLSSQPPVPTLPTIPECSDATSPTSFLLLGDDEENKETEKGREMEPQQTMKRHYPNKNTQQKH